MTAPREIELKLEVPVEGLRKLQRSQLLRGNHLPRKGAELVSVYFDTKKLKLRKKGVSRGCGTWAGGFCRPSSAMNQETEHGNGACPNHTECLGAIGLTF